ncbi:response regulator transcription factor [Terrisporobacter mayombei]|uniref:Stage 0 sporulation protein A homolog n=1 Tax=Terrisporobacter mayombei TaxID=1541 RepID=A0ABY9Q1J0_9FIRM|nr:response regulator transcription factor [Terrisporobacter mayombei]MCC3867205.1 response regulator transcription factor [Terrisporobacter mayombei]WMT81466.1 Transcriptional regulatory protein SrrA [Terrisporobacter mayombei]
MIKILVVDDEQKICEFVKAYLDREGYEVTVVYNGKSAIESFEDADYDLIILDRMLPDISGEKVCKQIRQKSEIPIIMLTAKIEDEDRIEGFTLGCDDYLCKPFNVRELVLRVKAILKRNNKLSDNNIIKFGNEVEIDTLSYDVRIRNKLVSLTNTEYKILLMLISNPHKVFTRIEILEQLEEGYYEKDDRAVDNHIKNLRQKIEENPKDCKIIQTVYGIGYKFGLKK